MSEKTGEYFGKIISANKIAVAALGVATIIVIPIPDNTVVYGDLYIGARNTSGANIGLCAARRVFFAFKSVTGVRTVLAGVGNTVNFVDVNGPNYVTPAVIVGSTAEIQLTNNSATDAIEVKADLFYSTLNL